MSNKSNKPKEQPKPEPAKQSYYFAHLGVSVHAASQEEAQELIIKQKEVSDGDV